jgi:hypothetical protein
MKLTAHLPHPKHCFCNIPIELLRKWYVKRHVEAIPTVELLEMAESEADKEAVCAVAMFDLDEDSMLEVMGDVNLPEHHIVHCRAEVQKQLSDEDCTA